MVSSKADALSPSAIATLGPVALDPLELATGHLFDLPARQVNLLPEMRTPRAVLEDVLLQHLQRGPVYVSFSGGRDSSAILAVAAHVARREGLPPPVPLTYVVVGSEGADETHWQALVLEHLGLSDHQVLKEITDELDVLGSVATEVLTEVGLCWPANGYMMRELAQLATGSTFLTGVGGDEVFDRSWAESPAQALAGAKRMSGRDALSIAIGTTAPALWRYRQRRKAPSFGWLNRRGNEEWARRFVAPLLPPHMGWAAQVPAFARGRMRAAALAGFQATCGPGVVATHPYLDDAFLRACATTGGKLGLGGRTQAMRSLVGDLLPATLVERPDKAHFSDATWARPSAAMRRSPEAMEAVAGDDQLRPFIDLDGLRQEWASDDPHFGTALLLQAVWLSGVRPSEL